MTDLSRVITALRAFEKDAREISATLTPMLAAGIHTEMRPVSHGGFSTGAVDNRLPHEIAGALNRIQVTLGDVAHIVGSALYDLRGMLLLRRKDISSTAKVVAIVAQYVYGIGVGDLPRRHLADLVGLSHGAINIAVKSIEAVDRCSADASLDTRWILGGYSLDRCKSENHAKSNTSSGNSFNSYNSKNSFLTAPAAQGQTERIQFDWETWQRFKQLVDLIDNTSYYGHKSMGGILAIARDWGDCLGDFTAAEVTMFVKAGLLDRVNNDIRVTQKSRDFYDWIERVEQQGEAA